MILSCSSCSAKYLVDIHQIKYGRHVKCFRCGHVWYHENKDYDPSIDDQIQSNNKKSSQTKVNDDSNLPVIYKKKKTVPLPFILLIFLVIFVFKVASAGNTEDFAGSSKTSSKVMPSRVFMSTPAIRLC